jgi:hypothetical protein
VIDGEAGNEELLKLLQEIESFNRREESQDASKE